MDELYIRIEELKHNDWFSTFLNSVAGAFDPHTTYMDPRIKDRFDQDMSENWKHWCSPRKRNLHAYR